MGQLEAITLVRTERLPCGLGKSRLVRLHQSGANDIEGRDQRARAQSHLHARERLKALRPADRAVGMPEEHMFLVGIDPKTSRAYTRLTAVTREGRRTSSGIRAACFAAKR